MELLINVFGQDRPGLISELTEIFYEHGANLGDMNMTRLGGSFALIFSVTLEQEHRSSIEKNLQQYANGKPIEFNSVAADGFHSEWSEQPANSVISVYGADQPGIVYRVTNLLGEHEINICDLNSSRSDEQGVYILVLEVARPDSINVDGLEALLTPLGDQLDVSIKVNSLAESPL